jgi:hypothetical protein
MADLPIIITAAGPQPRSPAEVLTTLLGAVEAVQPGYTARLPGILIEDISSTDVAAIVECDSAMVETINSLTPLGANEFLLAQLGQMLGISVGETTNTSVFLVFSGDPGFVIGQGFLVSDGTYQYRVVDGGIIQTDGNTAQLFAVATQAGTWAVPVNTVTQLVTQPPTGFVLTVTNPVTGVPGSDTETATSYRARVLQANKAASQGMATYLRTILGNIAGVQKRLIAARIREGGGWTIICGGGDPYAVAYGIWIALFDVSTIEGSVLFASNITTALPGVVSTSLNHGLTANENIQITGSNPSDYDGNLVAYQIVDEKTFKLGKVFDAQNISSISWASGGGGKVTATFGIAHGVTIGSSFVLVGNTPTGYNGTYTAISGTTSTDLVYAKSVDPGASSVLGQLSAGVALYDTSGFATYVGDAVITPNERNITVSINNFPDTYPITFINPPQQTVAVSFTWNTNSPNFVSAAAVAQFAAPAIAAYVNEIYVGQPINVFQMQEVFKTSIASILPPEYVTRMVISVSINGIGTAPDAGTGIVEGDPESYFYCLASDVSVVQG